MSGTQHHEFLDVFLQTFSFNLKAQHHVERNTEGGPVVAKSRPACLVSRKLSAKQCPSSDSGASYSLGKSRVGSELCFHKRWETSAGTESRNQQQVLKSGNEMTIRFKRWETGAGDKSAFRHWETSTRNSESTCKDELGLPQYENLRQSIP